jgi:hypothetical protein
MAQKKSNRTLTYFFLNGLLHKRLHINRGADELTAWCYPLKKRVTYSYTQTRRNYKPAFTTKQVASMLGRHFDRLERAILEGKLEEPQYTYGLTEKMEKYRYMWNEQDIMDAHAYFSTVHRGRPRKDGKITPQHLPTAMELRAMIRQEQILYVEQDGQFVPTWRATEF